MAQKFFRWPDETDIYLYANYGIPKRSKRTHKRRIASGDEPAPHYLSPQYPVLTKTELDEQGTKALAEVSAR
jgi:hypothetical protein